MYQTQKLEILEILRIIFDSQVCMSPTPFLNAVSEAGQKEEKSDFGGKGSLHIAASLKFSDIAFNYS